MIRTTEDGASFEVDGTWAPPDEIPETVVAECRRWLASHDAASGYAQEGRIKFWLLRLLGGLPGDYSPEVVQMKMAAYVFALSDKRAFCFDDATLRLAMRRFKFWPSASELVEFADDVDARVRQQAKRAQKVADTGSRRPGKEGKIDIDASMRRMCEKQERENREISEKLGLVPPRVAPRMLGETDREYGRRIALAAMRLCEAGQKALKRDEARHRAGAAPTAKELDEARAGMPPKPAPAETETETETVA